MVRLIETLSGKMVPGVHYSPKSVAETTDNLSLCVTFLAREEAPTQSLVLVGTNLTLTLALSLPLSHAHASSVIRSLAHHSPSLTLTHSRTSSALVRSNFGTLALARPD